MEPVPPAPRPPGQEPPHDVTVRGTHRSLSPALTAVVLAPLLVFAWIGARASPVLLLFSVVGLATVGSVVVRSGLIGLGWRPAELTRPPGPLLLGSRTELVYRRRPRRAVATTAGRLNVTLLCEERVVVGSGDNRSTRTAVVVRHVIEAPLTVTPAGVEARFDVEIPLVAGAPTLQITSAKAVQWRVEASLEGDGLPGDQLQFPLEVAAVISPAWFDRQPTA